MPCPRSNKGYDTHQKYPVLYLFHGKDGNADSWMDGSQGSGAVGVNAMATALIAEGKIRPLMIVSPEIDNGYGINTSLTTQSVSGYSRACTRITS
jgi:enterochelin esterase-like enzyme